VESVADIYLCGEQGCKPVEVVKAPSGQIVFRHLMEQPGLTHLISILSIIWSSNIVRKDAGIDRSKDS